MKAFDKVKILRYYYITHFTQHLERKQQFCCLEKYSKAFLYPKVPNKPPCVLLPSF